MWSEKLPESLDEGNECYCQAIKRTAGIGAIPEVCFERVMSCVSSSPHERGQSWVKLHKRVIV